MVIDLFMKYRKNKYVALLYVFEPLLQTYDYNIEYIAVHDVFVRACQLD